MEKSKLMLLTVLVCQQILLISSVVATNINKPLEIDLGRASGNQKLIVPRSILDDQQPLDLTLGGSATNLNQFQDPITTAASHHHHKKNVKGWLDMGAWTKKKGAFGWYADFPVGGKGK